MTRRLPSAVSGGRSPAVTSGTFGGGTNVASESRVHPAVSNEKPLSAAGASVET